MKSTSPPSPLPKLVHALVVEDDLFFQSAICEALKTCKTSITPSLASSAKQALRVLEADARSISLVLVDLGLPDDDGVNLLKTIKSQWPTLVCMVVSTSGERERVLAAMSEGACGYIVKGESTYLLRRRWILYFLALTRSVPSSRPTSLISYVTEVLIHSKKNLGSQGVSANSYPFSHRVIRINAALNLWA